MIHFLWPSFSKDHRHPPCTLEIGDIEDFDFSECAKQIYKILNTLEVCGLINKCPHNNENDIFLVIKKLLNDIDFEDDKLQISEYKHIRIEFRDELVSLEVFVGV